MIQLNLLPDVKQQFIKTRRLRRTISLIAIAASAASLGIMIFFLVTTSVWQSGRINKLDEEIEGSLSQLREKNDLSKILTIQNQLNSLNSVKDDDGNVIAAGLHDSKTATTRLFDYLQGLVPANVRVRELSLNFNESLITIEGTSDTFEEMNKFVDTLKFAQYSVGDSEDKKEAFIGIVLDDSTRDEEGVTYTIKGSFDPLLFDNTVDSIKLTIPNITTTRSSLERPEALFDAPDQPEEVQGGL